MHGLIFETSVCYWQNQPGCYLWNHVNDGVAEWARVVSWLPVLPNALIQWNVSYPRFWSLQTLIFRQLSESTSELKAFWTTDLHLVEQMYSFMPVLKLFPTGFRGCRTTVWLQPLMRGHAVIKKQQKTDLRTLLLFKEKIMRWLRTTFFICLPVRPKPASMNSTYIRFDCRTDLSAYRRQFSIRKYDSSWFGWRPNGFRRYQYSQLSIHQRTMKVFFLCTRSEDHMFFLLLQNTVSCCHVAVTKKSVKIGINWWYLWRWSSQMFK